MNDNDLAQFLFFCWLVACALVWALNGGVEEITKGDDKHD